MIVTEFYRVNDATVKLHVQVKEELKTERKCTNCPRERQSCVVLQGMKGKRAIQQCEKSW